MTVRHRYIALAEWEVCAALATAPRADAPATPPWRDGRVKTAEEIEALNAAASGTTFCQKRIPAGLWRVQPRVGALIWVQEPFIHFTGKGKDKLFEAIGYRADAGPAGGFPKTEELRNRQMATHVRDAKDMWRGASRLTLEITRTWVREWSFFEIGDREREGFRMLKAAFPAMTHDEAFATWWRRTYRGHTEERATKRKPVLMLQFKVHQMNIDALLAERAKVAA